MEWWNGLGAWERLAENGGEFFFGFWGEGFQEDESAADRTIDDVRTSLKIVMSRSPTSLVRTSSRLNLAHCPSGRGLG